jgi:hypothetical protein
LEPRGEITGGWRKLLNEELPYFRMIKSACMRKMRSVNKFSVRRSERKRPV